MPNVRHTRAVQMQAWRAPTASRPVDAVVAPPASKSLMARSLVLAALADAPTTLHNPLVARDSLLMAQALRALGARVDAPTTGSWQVHPGVAGTTAQIDCGLSGTVMRFVPPIAALGSASVAFDGDAAARRRPMAELLDALRALRVVVSPDGADALPFVVRGAGRVDGGALTIDSRTSSQVVSGLLLAASRFEDGLRLRTTTAPPSAPHIAMTLSVLAERGVPARAVSASEWLVEPARPAGGEVVIEPDVSNAAPFLAAAVATAGTVRVPHWPRSDRQPSHQLTDLLRAFGAKVSDDAAGLTVTGPTDVRGLGTVDLAQVSELVPTVVALAALADAPTTVVGVGHIRGHETNRIDALTRSLTLMGGDASATDEGLVVRPAALHGARLASEGDHRMATFAAIVGLRVPGVQVDDVSVTSKTMPAFPLMWQDMLS